MLAQLVRRVNRLEEILEPTREGTPPDRGGFDALESHLANRGIETDMEGPEVHGEDEEE